VAKAVDYGVDSVHDVLTAVFGLDGTLQGDEFRIHCPNPDHPDGSPSTDVNIDTGYWSCFSCGVGGDLADLGKRVLGIPRRDVIEMLKPNTPEALLSAVQRKIAAIRLPTARGRKKVAAALPGPYEPASASPLVVRELCEARGFSKGSLDRWGIRYVKEQELINSKGEPFNIYESIGIPIRDAKGRLLSWCYRSTSRSQSWQPRYLYTPGTEPSEMWFGLQHNNPDKVRDIAVGEGALDAAWIDQCGYPALGLLGSKMGAKKINYLLAYDSVTLFADRDNAGAQWLARVGGAIGNKVPTRVVRYHKTIVNTYSTLENKGKLDPQMLMPLDIELSMETSITWGSFKLRSAS
jgi:hypothetical protein